ncbi:MAG: GNAT family N-acetyltransferase [Sarcina sp.]
MEIIIKEFDNLTLNELYSIMRERVAVFAIEQNVKVEDLDYLDQKCHHVMLKENNELLAYCRIIPKGIWYDALVLSRVIVRKDKRGQDYGYRVCKEALKFIDNNLKESIVQIPSQEYAKGFYEKLGFKVIGEPYIKAGISHVEMKRELKK